MPNQGLRPLFTRGHRLLAFAFTLFFASHAGAWARQGHEIAGHIAEQYLSDAARSRVFELFRWETLADSSTWPDRMRSDPSPYWQNEAPPYHYITVPPGSVYSQRLVPPEGDAVTALSTFADDLRNPDTNPDRQRLALRFALHIIQDLHQPLHVGNGRDRGGNSLSVKIDGETENFHRIWDYHVIADTSRSNRQWLQFLEKQGLLRAPRPEDVNHLQWIAESVELRNTLYPVPAEIDDAYLAQYGPLAAERVALAGIRSAAWLNAVLSGESGSGQESPPTPSLWQRLIDMFSSD